MASHMISVLSYNKEAAYAHVRNYARVHINHNFSGNYLKRTSQNY